MLRCSCQPCSRQREDWNERTAQNRKFAIRQRTQHMEIFAVGGWKTEIADHRHKAGISDESSRVEISQPTTRNPNSSQHGPNRQYANRAVPSGEDAKTHLFAQIIQRMA